MFKVSKEPYGVHDMIRSFASSATSSMVAKNGTTKIIPLLYIKSPPVDRFWCFRYLNNHIDLPDMIDSSGTTSTVVAKS